jgi:large conductance mechanosensitive channel
MLKGFKQFILRGNVIDLAVGVVMGAAFNTVVQSLVKDLFTPIIGIFGKIADFSRLYFTVNGSRFMYGDFVNAIISFIILAIAIYFFIVVPMNHLVQRMKGKQPPVDPTSKKCPECLSEIPIQAKKCAFCTSSLQ